MSWWIRHWSVFLHTSTVIPLQRWWIQTGFATGRDKGSADEENLFTKSDFFLLKHWEGETWLPLIIEFAEFATVITFPNNPNSTIPGSQWQGLHWRGTAFISYWNGSGRQHSSAARVLPRCRSQTSCSPLDRKGKYSPACIMSSLNATWPQPKLI